LSRPLVKLNNCVAWIGGKEFHKVLERGKGKYFRAPLLVAFYAHSLTLKMKGVHFSKTLANFYHL
jgi:hypothetical protein